MVKIEGLVSRAREERKWGLLIQKVFMHKKGKDDENGVFIQDSTTDI